MREVVAPHDGVRVNETNDLRKVLKHLQRQPLHRVSLRLVAGRRRGLL